MKQLERNSTSTASLSHLENILNEVQLLSGIDHPRIVRLFEKYRTQKAYHILLEYCNGGDLQSFLQKYRSSSGVMNFLGSIQTTVIL